MAAEYPSGIAEPIRALHIVTWLNRGGLETWLLQLLQNADRRRLAIDVCCKGVHVGEMAPEARAAGAAVIHAPMGRWGHWSRRYRRSLATILRDGRYDVVHSHLGDLSEPILDAALDAGVPRRVVMYHLVEHRFEQQAILRAALRAWQRHARRSIVRKATSVLGCSRSVLDAVLPARRGSTFGVLHPSVDPNRLRPDTSARDPVRRELGLAEDMPLVVNVGNLGYAKNQRAIVEAAVVLRERRVRAVFLVVGEGPLRGELERQLAARGVDDAVRLLGSRRDVARLLQAADVAVHPSVAEGLPVSVLEYQSVGLPVVGSLIAPVVEALAPSNRPLATRPTDALGLAEAVARLLNDPALRRDLGAAGRVWVVERFSVDRCLDDLIELYAAVSSGPDL
jgi:glycosyltransferase involved in cell wall biosynthesis